MLTDLRIGRTRAVRAVLVFLSLVILAACSSKAMNLMFDLPPPEPEAPPVETEAAPRRPAASPAAAGYWEDPEAKRPLIEAATNWKQALEMLPADKKGNVNWSEAVREGTIKPRALKPEDLGAKAFQMDFFIAAKKEKNDAWFPHSAHTEWLGCKNCHNVNLYPYQRNPATMKEMKKGASCGACHSKIAFSLRSCKRCHLKK